MSIISIPNYDHYPTSYRPTRCPFRIRHTSKARSQLSHSWCAHHDFSDARSCNLNQPCTAIATIAKDPSFHIQTALLWIRSNDSIRRRATTRLFSSEDDPRLPEIILNDAIQGHSPADKGITIRPDKPDLGLLHLHRDRLAAAAEAIGWGTLEPLKHDDASLTLLKQSLEKYMSGLDPLPVCVLESRKVRILVERCGKLTIDSTTIGLTQPTSHTSLLTTPFMPSSFDEQPPPDNKTPPCKVILDTQPTRPSTLTTHKTTHRCMYTSARERTSISPTTPPNIAEVLLYNPYNEVIETSTCTIYFKRDGKWITPAAICGPNLGVSRRLAIEGGLCRQGVVERWEVRCGEGVWLSNAVRGFFRGVVVDGREGRRMSESGGEREGSPGFEGGGAGVLKRASN
ncbi:Aminodeoxychorismate lyase [Knufia obscura]|uniref:Aminodeoxychorismate lyase n=1 Tax=Knufia obscura TaxID=1635080 RepID=A0ABR0RNX4_9EURO|nr:Aminodeoxychorismate lyase [Knufia obscura]